MGFLNKAAIAYLTYSDDGVNGIVLPTYEFDALRPARKADLIGDWIGELRGLYAIVREEAENSYSE
jgi:hypothetical protein